MKFTLYPILWASDESDDEQFNRNELPADIAEDVRIEFVGGQFCKSAFDHLNETLGTDIVKKFENVQYALVHRYNPATVIERGKYLTEDDHQRSSDELVRMIAASLRLIRPMRQGALAMHGNIRDENGSFDVMGADIPPLHLLEVPKVQKLFKLRNQDVDALRTYAPEFLRGMRGDYWKFRMAVQFHELGHFQSLDWKARYLLWCSAIESIYTSNSWEHRGSLVAISRIKWFLGENTSIYAPGDISNLLTDPHITIGQIVDDLYEVRNFMAHGDRIPDRFFTEVPRHDFNGPVSRLEVVTEAASFIIRASLLKILRGGMLNHFADAGPAEAYFGAQKLTKSGLRAASKP